MENFYDTPLLKNTTKVKNHTSKEEYYPTLHQFSNEKKIQPNHTYHGRKDLTQQTSAKIKNFSLNVIHSRKILPFINPKQKKSALQIKDAQ
jgi:hypothetical protein